MKKLLTLIAILTLNIYAQKVYATFDVKADRSADLAFTSGGLVSSVLVHISDIVKKGDTIATLQSDDLKAKLNIAMIAKANAQSNYDRQQIAKSVIQQSILDNYKFQRDSSIAQVVYLKSLLDKTILKAPFDGIISVKKVEVGDAVSGAAIRTVFEIQSKRKRKLVLEFDQKYWANVQVGDKFEYSVDGDDTPRVGTIAKIYPNANTSSRKMQAEVYANDLIVGLFGNGYIITKEKGSR